MSSNSTANQCRNCPASTQATVWCGDCNQCYCSSCSTELHKIQAFSHHQPMPINQKPPTPAYCPAHGEETKLWCYDHETLICSVCVALEHQGHKTAFFKNVSKEKSTELEQQLHLAQSSLNDHLDLAKQFISIGFNQKAAIAETFRRLRAMLNEHEKQLNERIDEIEQINRNATETHQAQLNSVKMQLDVQGKRLAEILSGNNPINILQQCKSLGDAIKELSQQLSNVKSPGITVFEVKGIDKIQTAMMDCLPLIYMETRQGIPVIPQNAKWARNGTTVIKGLNRPRGLAVDERDGTIYVADFYNHRIVASKPGDTNGRVVAGGNSQGQGLNPLDQPTDVLLDKENNSIIISDYGNQRVMRWSLQSGTTQGETMIDDIDCYGLAMDDYGALYVTVPSGKHEVRRYPKGYTNYTIVAGGNGSGDGTHKLNRPEYIAVDSEGTVYVSDCGNHRVVKWVKGAKEGIVVAGGRGDGKDRTQLSSPQGIVIDSNGTLYVTEGGNHRVTRWRKGVNESDILVGGNGWGSESHQLYHPAGLSFDGQGNLFVADRSNNRVQRFSIE